MIGRGGFGEVYRGTLPTGTEVAVKRLSKTSGQGAQEFKSEAVLVTKLQHRNLVRLLGFCLEGEEKILVYEFVPNKSLDYFLFDPAKQGELDWTRRYNIIGGIARGILYIHHDSRLTIIHHDLNASNILLDADMNPNLVIHTWRLWRNGSPLELLDSTIRESYQSNEVIRCIHIALLCVQEDPADRSMLPAIVVMLSSSTETLPVPRAPGFCLSSWPEQSTSTSFPSSINDVSITYLDAR